MLKIAEYTEKIPAYSLSYLINDDSSGISLQDKLAIDKYMSQFYAEAKSCSGEVYIEVNDVQAEPYFTWSPAFGLACDVVDCNILILKSEWIR